MGHKGVPVRRVPETLGDDLEENVASPVVAKGDARSPEREEPPVLPWRVTAHPARSRGAVASMLIAVGTTMVEI